MTSAESSSSDPQPIPTTSNVFRYSVSGCAAHTRLVPLLPPDWKDVSPSFKLTTHVGETGGGALSATPSPVSTVNEQQQQQADGEHYDEVGKTSRIPDFVWENAPRKETKAYRDNLKAYSHLPNGTAILDSKWVLARLFEETKKKSQESLSGENDSEAFPLLAVLESHCFRGPAGYKKFCERMFCNNEKGMTANPHEEEESNRSKNKFPDLMVQNGVCPTDTVLPPEPTSLWVVKDAFSNGAGGIWVVDKASAATLESSSNNNSGPLYDDHRYVAQRYAWPPVLYGGRKCHVRVYGLITSDGRAFVHKRAFLHVANDEFSYDTNDGDDNNNIQERSKEGENSSNVSFKRKKGHFEDSVHITNCCANSHDDSKFAGEILADLEATEPAVDQETGQTIVPLGIFFTSMKSSLAALTHRAMPFLSGGQMNNGMEYLGMDFILSYKDISNNQNDKTNAGVTGEREPLNLQPVAYLLEVNAPPSQDTATGLKHAEDLHDDVIRDILSLWVLPKVAAAAENPGGWRLAYSAPQEDDEAEYILPSKAAIINKIRWGMTERKAMKEGQANKDAAPSPTSVQSITETSATTLSSPTTRYVTSNGMDALSSASQQIQEYARSKYPFYQRSTDSAACGATEGPHINDKDDDGCDIFMENAGGAQVPMHVIDKMCQSLCHRNRSVVGSKTKESARFSFCEILGASPEEYSVFLGANATSLLSGLATKYVQLGLLDRKDEIVLSTESHLANVTPWLEAAKVVGAKIKWWAPTRSVHVGKKEMVVSTYLEDLLTENTRIVAISHASNILGQVRDLAKIRGLVDSWSRGHAHLVVDGVAAAPHCFPAVSSFQVDWYVVSAHKLFGPHLGALCGRRHTALKEMRQSAMIDGEGSTDAIYKLLEVGTVNYEGCAGIEGLGDYFADLATFDSSMPRKGQARSVAQATQTPYQCPWESSAGSCQQGNPYPSLTRDLVMEAYRRIRTSEEALTEELLSWLRGQEKVRIIEIPCEELACVARLPVISFVHTNIKSSTIVDSCFNNSIACRHGSFLSNEHLLRDFGVSNPEGVVRLSLAHYNTCKEITFCKMVLESIPGWI